jgi:hypothetical protein
VRLDEPQTFPSVARAVGWTDKWAGRRLLRLCLRREKELGKKFIVRDSRGAADKVTLGAVSKYLPELRPSRVEALSDNLRTVAEELARRQRSLASEELAKRLAPLLARLAELERRQRERDERGATP